MKNTALGREVYGAFSYGNTLNQLIIVNLFVFLLVTLLRIILSIGNDSIDAALQMEAILRWVRLPLRAEEFIVKPYTLFTYIFLHEGLLHFFFNMFSLYIFGRIFREFLGGRRLWPVYIFGGIAGGVLTLLFNILFPNTILSADALLGASASVMAIIFAIVFLYPDLPLHMIFFGPVRLKYIALFILVMDLVGISYAYNVGGHISHIGGMLMGIVYALEFKRKRDLAAGFIMLTNRFNRNKEPAKVKMKVAYRRALTDEEYNTIKMEKESTLDELLDKISAKGIKSLTRKEKELLEKYSKE